MEISWILWYSLPMEKEVVDQKIREITKKIAQEYQPEKIILFGSWAWGTPNEDSDVDLLIVKDSDKPRIEREREVRELLWPPGIAMDIIVYSHHELEKRINHDRNLFLEDIVRNGRLIYEKSNNDPLRLTHKPAVLVI